MIMAHSKMRLTQPSRRRVFGMTVLLALLISSWLKGEAAEPSSPSTNAIPIATITRTNAVNFATEILPIFRKNCLACHNSTDAKGDLVMENPTTLRKGGETGTAVVPMKASESLLIKLAARLEKPFMPPKNNKADAQPLTPQELGLVQLWINQGATGTVSNTLAPIVWQALPLGLSSINAVAMSSDGQFAACARGNQVFVHDIPTARFLTRLSDPELSKSPLYKDREVADRDVIESLAFSPDGQRLASGGYRSIKLWRHQPDKPLPLLGSNWISKGETTTFSHDGKWAATITTDHLIQLRDAVSGTVVRELLGHTGEIRQVQFSYKSGLLASISQDKSMRVWNLTGTNAVLTNTITGDARALTWLGNDQQIATSGHAIELWSATPSTNTAPLQKLGGHTKPITALVGTSGEEFQLVSADEEGLVKLWDTKKSAVVREWKIGNPVTAMAFDPILHRIAAITAQSCRIIDTEKNEPIADLKNDLLLVTQASQRDRDLNHAKAEVSFHKTTIEAAETSQKAETEALKKVTDIRDAANKVSAEKKEVVDKSKTARDMSDNHHKSLRNLLKIANDNKSLADKLNSAAQSDLARANDRLKQASEVNNKAQETRAAAYKAVLEAAATKAPDSESTIDRATVAKNALDASALLKSAAEKDVREATERNKAGADQLASATGAVSPLESQGNDAENKLKDADKALAEAGEAHKKADGSRQLAEQNFQSTSTVLKNIGEMLARNKANFALAEKTQKESEAKAVAAREQATKTTHAPRSVAILSGLNLLAVGTQDGLILTYSAVTGLAKEILKLPNSGNEPPPVNALISLAGGSSAILRPGQQPMSLGFAGKWVHERTLGTGDDHSVIVDRVLSLVFSHDGTKLASGGGAPSRSGEIKIWETSDGKLLRDFKDPHSDTIYTLSFSHDDLMLASGGADKFGRIFEVNTGKQVKTFEGHTHHVLGITWKRDGRSIATAGADKVVKIWDVPSGEQRKTIGDFGKEVTSIQFLDASNEFVASSGDQQIRQARENGETVRTMNAEGDFVQSAAVTPDGRYVLAGGHDGTLRLFDALKGSILHSFAAPKPESPHVAGK